MSLTTHGRFAGGILGTWDRVVGGSFLVLSLAINSMSLTVAAPTLGVARGRLLFTPARLKVVFSQSFVGPKSSRSSLFDLQFLGTGRLGAKGGEFMTDTVSAPESSIGYFKASMTFIALVRQLRSLICFPEGKT